MQCTGQKIVVATQTGRSIGGPIEDYAPEWEAMTGGEVELQQFDFGNLFEKIVTSFETGANDYDMIVFPADWAGDFMAAGYLEPIPQAILDSIDPKDIIPLYGDRITAWGDTVYALPYDGDAHMLYYRKDLVNPESPFAAEFQDKFGYPLDEPKTWKQYYDIAEFFNGREVETAGESAPIYGVAEAQKRGGQSYWVFLSHAAGYGKVPGNPCFFFSCEDMTPQVNNPGWVAALDDYIKSRDLGSPQQSEWDVAQTRIMFPAGVSVLNIDWGDVGPMSYNPDTSVIAGNTGFGVLPAADRYWDYVKGEWVEEVNEAPFIAFGGWIIGIAKDSDVKECALDFGKFMARPELVKKLAVNARYRDQPVALQPARGRPDVGGRRLRPGRRRGLPGCGEEHHQSPQRRARPAHPRVGRIPERARRRGQPRAGHRDRLAGGDGQRGEGLGRDYRPPRTRGPVGTVPELRRLHGRVGV